jgi:hypothetical protein
VKKGRRSLNIRVPGCLALALAVLGTASPAADAVQPPYEPNDSLLTAYGPLGLNQTYTAAMETENDRDYFYFYVTSPSSSQVTVTIKDLGGGLRSYNGASFEIQDSHGSGISGAGVSNIGDYRTVNVTLTAGKYYIEVEPDDGYSATYSLTTAGTEGAFGEYGPIAAQCASATAPVTLYQAQLAKAEARLKAAEAALRRAGRSRKRRVRKKARARYVRAKATVAAEKESLKNAKAGQKPWCEIPQ